MPLANSSFYTGPRNLYFPVGIVTGICRSGKTLLGNILATCSNVEYVDEPWTGMQLPAIVASGNLDRDFATNMLATYVCELFNDLVLLRRANFRPDDLSSIWSKKQPGEIFHRLGQLHSRADVIEFATKHRTTLVMTLAESTPFVEFLCEAVPNAKLVHVVRDGLDVARDVEAKGWFADANLRSPSMAVLYTTYDRGGETLYLPWWIDPGDEAYFCELTDYERGIYYWCSLMEKGLTALDTCGCVCMSVSYERLVEDPQHEIDRVCQFLGCVPGALTDAKVAEVRASTTSRAGSPTLDPALLNRVNALRESLQDMA